jgi:hypothetical protein
VTPLLTFFCWLTRTRPDLLARSNIGDKMTVVAGGVALLTVAGVSLLAWSAFFAAFSSLIVAVPLALLVAFAIVQLDAAIAASDWEVAGRLRDGLPPRAVGHWVKLGVRLVVALFLSFFTAMGVTLTWFGDIITSHLQAKRAAANAPLEREYGVRASEIKTRLVQNLEAELSAAREARAGESQRQAELRSKHQRLLEEASRATIEAGRELDGLNRAQGAGPRYRDAVRQREEADRMLPLVTTDLENARSQLRELEQRVQKLDAQLLARGAQYEAARRALFEEMIRDGRWMPVRDDPLLRVKALRELQDDPQYGDTLRMFVLMTVTGLVLIELMFLLAKLVFAPASVYTVRLIAETKLEAAEVSADFARRLAAIKAGHPRGSIEIGAAGQNPAAVEEPAATSSGGQYPPVAPRDVISPAKPVDEPATGQPPREQEVPVIGAKPARSVSLRAALGEPSRYHVDLETKTVYDRAYWDELHAAEEEA